jgi:hypothetical protein
MEWLINCVYFVAGDEERTEEQQKMVLGHFRSVNLTGLSSFTTYVITVRSFTKKGSSVQSPVVFGTTLEGGR